MNRVLNLLAMIVAFTAPAFADVFSFSYSGIDFFSSLPASGSGFFTAQFDSPGVYTIVGISGSATFGSTLYPITGLVSSGFLEGTDMLFVPPSPGYFAQTAIPSTFNSVAFTLSNGAVEVFSNVILEVPGGEEGFYIEEFSPGAVPGQYHFAEGVAFSQAAGSQITDITSPVPEPTTFVLIGTGLVGIASAAWRRLLV